MNAQDVMPILLLLSMEEKVSVRFWAEAVSRVSGPTSVKSPRRRGQENGS